MDWSAQVLAEAGVTVETACASYRRNFSELYVDDYEIVINPRRATTHNKVAKKRYQRVQYHTVLIYKIAIFVKVLRSRVMA